MFSAQYQEFCTLAHRRSIIFYYVGFFSQTIIASMGEAIKTRVEQGGAEASTRRKIFSSFIEMSQNIIHYSVDAATPSDQRINEMRHGSVCIGIDQEKYFLICCNPVKVQVAEMLEEKLRQLRTMTIDEIKSKYKQTLRSDTPDDSKGAGLGLLTMARDATEPLEFKFTGIDGSDDMMFFLKATV